MAKAYLGLGTNLGDKKNNLETSISKIENRIGQVTGLSDFYVSAPWGFESRNEFVNAALCVETNLTPKELLKATQEIELEIGRTQKSINHSYQDRLIDIDILLYDNLTYKDDKLEIPHKYICERDFVLIPLLQINKELTNPKSGKKLIGYIKDKQALDKLK